MIVSFGGLNFDLPVGWTDITDDLPEGSPPSLARPHGAGVIQFSTAKYRGGEQPNLTTADLRRLLQEFCLRNSICCDEIIERTERIMSARSRSKDGIGLIEIGYFSNGSDVALITYICEDKAYPGLDEDIAGTTTILNSLSF